jgi:glyoxylate reductase
MKKPNLLITRKFFADILEKYSSQFEVNLWDGDTPPSHDWILNNIANADALFCMLNDRINDAVIEKGASSRLKVISQMAVGVDNIAISTATWHGIPVGHTPGVLTETTADFAWALLMAAARRVVESHVEVQNGVWRPWGPEVLCGTDVYGATLGLIGFGRIGKAMARRAAGFNMKVLYYEPRQKSENAVIENAKYVSLEELLAKSDFVSLHAYLSESTKGMIGRDELAKMKPGAILVNTARGAMVDHTALLNALREGQIAGAALDVFDPEPIPRDHPLLTMPNVIVTPHIASSTTATRKRMAVMTLENINAGLAGEKLPHCVNPEVYAK